MIAAFLCLLREGLMLGVLVIKFYMTYPVLNAPEQWSINVTKYYIIKEQ